MSAKFFVVTNIPLGTTKHVCTVLVLKIPKLKFLVCMYLSVHCQRGQLMQLSSDIQETRRSSWWKERQDQEQKRSTL